MHGHGFPPPQPPRPTAGSLIALRVVFSAVTVLSCGLLGWIPMLRLAIVTRRALHWILLCALIVFHVACLIYVGESTLEEDPEAELSDAAALVLIAWFAIGTFGVLTYYLITDIRHYDRIAAPPPPALPMPGSPYQTAVPSYGCPPAPVHRHPAPAPQPQFPTGTPPHPAPTPPTAPAPQPQAAPRPAPASEPPRSGRIEQVRAELDELSDLLRKEEDR
ncbi:hypothetical protein AB0K02_05145 [Streptomyces sp. NPDC049597]|uniref:hypothetical protein n=1 Tax=Streptomyces sp. NPDC049597 TaxID=3155276 RepID=UPI0034178B46